MKKVLLFILLPLLSMAQTQIGGDNNGKATDDRSGTSVSISSDGSIVAIGAPYNTESGVNAGSVRVYKNVSGTWTQLGSDINGKATGDRSGTSVSISSDGSIVAIGAPYNTESGVNAGSVRVYQNVSGTWTQIGADINGEAADDYSGTSVSLSSDGTIVAIGAPYNDASGSTAGSVRVYQNVSGTWTQLGADINGEAANDYSGTTVSLSSDGTTIAIGAPNNDGSGADAGSVRVYQNISGTWTQLGADINGEAANDQSGYSVSLSSDGTILAIGARNNDGSGNNAGHVRVYQNVSGTWTQLGGDIDGEAAVDVSGWSVSLSSDGTIVAIGAIGNDASGGSAGSVRVYKNVSGTWTKIGTDIDGEAVSDQSGTSVSLSSDGATVAIGAPRNDASATDAGHVRVYDLTAVLSSDSFVLSNFLVYPNPATEVITITLQENLQLEKVNIYNTLGQLIKTEKSNSINVSSLSKGSYYFEVITNQGKATKTVLVQ
jgi:Flp pilus assembly pilin Flp